MKKKVFRIIFYIFFWLGINGYAQTNNEIEEFVKKGWEYSISLIKTAETTYFVEWEKDKGKYLSRFKVNWKYKNNKEMMDIDYFGEDGKIYQNVKLLLDFHEEMSNILISEGEKKEATINKDGILPTAYIFLPPSFVLFRFCLRFPIISLKEILSKGWFEKKERYKDEECYIIVYQNLNKVFYKFWVSPQNGFLPVKVELWKEKYPLTIMEITYKKFDIIFFPVEIIGYSIREGKQGPSTRIIYQDIKINSPIDDSIFILNFKPGTKVYDERTKSSFVVPEK